MALDFSSLAKALDSLEKAIKYFNQLPTEISPNIVRDSVIQRFKNSYELSWKMLQRWIKNNISPEDAEPRTKKDLFRLAAKKKMISDPEQWFEFAEARNHSAHTYNEKKANYVFAVAVKFLPAAQLLCQELKKHND